MRDNKLVIQIKRSVSEVFEFTTNPKNTPLWIDFVASEETSEWPVKVGTVYKNTNKKGEVFTFTMIDLKPNESFTMIGGDKNYHCKYTYRDLGNNNTEFEYYEWMETGELEVPFTQDILEKLKTVLENPQP